MFFYGIVLCFRCEVGLTKKEHRSMPKKAVDFAENKLDVVFQDVMCSLRDFTHTFLFFGVLFDELCRMRMLSRWAMSKCRLFCSPYI